VPFSFLSSSPCLLQSLFHREREKERERARALLRFSCVFMLDLVMAALGLQMTFLSPSSRKPLELVQLARVNQIRMKPVSFVL
jgi:hypothetical protein